MGRSADASYLELGDLEPAQLVGVVGRYFTDKVNGAGRVADEGRASGHAVAPVVEVLHFDTVGLGYRVFREGTSASPSTARHERADYIERMRCVMKYRSSARIVKYTAIHATGVTSHQGMPAPVVTYASPPAAPKAMSMDTSVTAAIHCPSRQVVWSDRRDMLARWRRARVPTRHGRRQIRADHLGRSRSPATDPMHRPPDKVEREQKDGAGHACQKEDAVDHASPHEAPDNGLAEATIGRDNSQRSPGDESEEQGGEDPRSVAPETEVGIHAPFGIPAEQNLRWRGLLF